MQENFYNFAEQKNKFSEVIPFSHFSVLVRVRVRVRRAEEEKRREESSEFTPK